jgi:hypothetical protein
MSSPCTRPQHIALFLIDALKILDGRFHVNSSMWSVEIVADKVVYEVYVKLFHIAPHIIKIVIRKLLLSKRSIYFYFPLNMVLRETVYGLYVLGLI